MQTLIPIRHLLVLVLLGLLCGAAYAAADKDVNVINTPGVVVTNAPEVSVASPGFSGSNTYAGGHSVRLYAEQYFSVRFVKVAAVPGASMELGTAHAVISGYLVPQGSASLAP